VHHIYDKPWYPTNRLLGVTGGTHTLQGECWDPPVGLTVIKGSAET